ncbi:MAG: NHL repeat-containing protein [Chloroflexota bacterium]|nr:NHL repeat-containing protein [Chloroflexota bacterium]
MATQAVEATPPLISPGTIEPGAPLEQIWEAKGPTGDEVLFHPAIDPEGRIWAPVARANHFLIFDRDGNYLESWGESGDGEGQFNFRHPWSDAFGGIAFAPDGSFYVSEGGNRRVQKFDPERNFVLSWGSFGPAEDQFLAPDAVALDGVGNVYVHDDEPSVHKMFTSDGEFVRSFAEGSTPWVAVSPDGHVYAQMWERNVLNEYAPDGSLVRSIDLDGLASLPRVADLEVDAQGRLWVSSVDEQGEIDVPDKLFVLDADGQLLHRWDGTAVTQFVVDPAGDRIYTTFFRSPSLVAYAVPEE